MKIRFFNTYEPVSPFYRDLIPFLASCGIESEVVVSAAVYRDRPNLEQAIGHMNQIDIFRTENLGLHAGTKSAKMGVILLYVIHAVVRSLFGPPVDCNVFLTQPPLFAVWGHVLGKIRDQAYYCVVMDVYPQEAVEFGALPRNALFTKFLAYLSGLALRNAKGVIVIGRCMADRVAAMGVQQENIHFIPNWIDEEVVKPVSAEDNPLRRDQDWQGRFVVLYGGNIGMAQYFDDLLTVAEGLKSDDDVLFVLIGDGSRKTEIEKTVENLQLTNVVLLPFLHGEYSLAEILSAGDVHFISLRDACTGLGVPSKASASLAVGRPIIYQGSAGGEIAQMIVEEGIGAVVSCGDVGRLREVISVYASRPRLRKRQGLRARELAEGPYSRGAALERYAALLLDSR